MARDQNLQAQGHSAPLHTGAEGAAVPMASMGWVCEQRVGFYECSVSHKVLAIFGVGKWELGGGSETEAAEQGPSG